MTIKTSPPPRATELQRKRCVQTCGCLECLLGRENLLLRGLPLQIQQLWLLEKREVPHEAAVLCHELPPPATLPGESPITKSSEEASATARAQEGTRSELFLSL